MENNSRDSSLLSSGFMLQWGKQKTLRCVQKRNGVVTLLHRNNKQPSTTNTVAGANSINCETSVSSAASFVLESQNHHFLVARGSVQRDYKYLEALTGAEVSHCELSSQKGTIAFVGCDDSASWSGIPCDSNSSSEPPNTTSKLGLNFDLNLPPPVCWNSL